RRTTWDPDSRATWVAATVLCLAIARHRASIEAFAGRLPWALRTLTKRYDDDDDDDDDDLGDLPDLAPLVRDHPKIKRDDDELLLPDDRRRDAYVWCRHDLGICARSPPASSLRAWDDALGSVPRDLAQRWNKHPAERRPPAADLPPPRRC
ncbi:hypothetical protein CTAYLR_007147, partial [Chrysophaeum taylorii]